MCVCACECTCVCACVVHVGPMCMCASALHSPERPASSRRRSRPSACAATTNCSTEASRPSLILQRSNRSWICSLRTCGLATSMPSRSVLLNPSPLPRSFHSWPICFEMLSIAGERKVWVVLIVVSEIINLTSVYCFVRGAYGHFKNTGSDPFN